MKRARSPDEHAPPTDAKLGDRWCHPDDVEGTFAVQWTTYTCDDPTPIKAQRVVGCGRTWFGWAPVRNFYQHKRGPLGYILGLCPECIERKTPSILRRRARKKL